MKYVIGKNIQSFSALNDWQGLGQKNAEALENKEAIELKKPPKHLVEGNYIVEAKNKKGAK
jgi:hypothetical protein|tara:strand:- start:2216 stop:2398 length:183 start_codon:yes stop_codon:yes gene_type:complete